MSNDRLIAPRQWDICDVAFDPNGPYLSGSHDDPHTIRVVRLGVWRCKRLPSRLILLPIQRRFKLSQMRQTRGAGFFLRAIGQPISASRRLPL